MNQHLSIKNIKNPPKNAINAGFKKISSISINTKKYYFFIIRNEKVDSSIPFIGTSNDAGHSKVTLFHFGTGYKGLTPNCKDVSFGSCRLHWH
jgi:hypothetical protein